MDWSSELAERAAAVLAVLGEGEAVDVVLSRWRAVLGADADADALRALASTLVGALVEVTEPGDSGVERGTRLSMAWFFATNEALLGAGRAPMTAVQRVSRLSELEAHQDPP